MEILVVDDEKFALKNMVKELEKALVVLEKNHKNDTTRLGEPANIHAFSDAREAIDYVQKPDRLASSTNCDVAFLDVEMRDIGGLELAGTIKKAYPRINIIFTTGYTDYMEPAFDLHASGYCLKPITAEKLVNEMENLRHEIRHDDVVQEEDKRLVVKTFGNFEAFIDNMPIHFKYSKSKELLAYLIDRNGALCTNREIMSVLWEEDLEDHISYLKKVRSELVGRLKDSGCEDAIVQQWGAIGVVPDKIKCDYFDYLSGSSDAEKSYRGEYMTQYGWSEYTHGILEN